ncbi:BrnT family toxin [Rhizobium tumorigenes]|uniref:BrnT family toxin n=1 Tax=Rhizobium tumorigenes TaxID=2041385 RepID=UPI00241DD3F6|nr:BrnT family toxin [Rhizobium tumorigenes]WFS01666.1 BrnT family toxin [Rhizobium tumorigenes]
MAIIFDPTKRDRALAERGLDFARCSEIFAGKHITFEDERKNYGEPRFITIARLDSRMIVVVWTPRDGHERIISMRRANDREQRDYERDLDRRG